MGFNVSKIAQVTDHHDQAPKVLPRKKPAKDTPRGNNTPSRAESLPTKCDTFLPFLEFPTAKLLREANEDFHRAERSLPRSPEVALVPYPALRSKKDVFDPATYTDIDSRAISAPAFLADNDIEVADPLDRAPVVPPKEQPEEDPPEEANDVHVSEQGRKSEFVVNKDAFDPDAYKDIDSSTTSAPADNDIEVTDNQDQASEVTPQGQPEEDRPDDDATSNAEDLPITCSTFLPFLEFPTPKLLREANEDFHRAERSLPRSQEVALVPYPARRAKKDVFDPDAYKDIDLHAISAPESLVDNDIETLVSYLMKDVRSEMGKVRAIFCWITAQDLTSHKGTDAANIKETTVLWRLWSLANEKNTYTNLFLDMCRAAQIQCEKIVGYVKAKSYEPWTGDTNINWEDHQSIWAAVYIDNDWFIVDASHGSRYSSGGGSGEWVLIDDNGKGRVETESEPERLQYQHDEAYFLTNPEQIVYDHFPIDEKWQLLARPVRLEEFEEMAILKPAFFDLDLELKDERKCLLHAPDGEVEIQIGVPETERRYFMYQLWKYKKEDEEESHLERFVLMQQNPGVLICKLQFPVAGTFKLDVFGRGSKSDFCRPCCRFIIICDRPMDNCRPLPENVRREWGPGLDLLDAGLEAVSHPDATVEAEQGVTKIKFKTIKDNIEILHNLHSNTMTTDALENNVIHYFHDGECIVDLKLPEIGDYALNLFAKDTGTEGSFSNVCSYVVSSATAALDPTPFPSVANGTFGALDDNKTYQLKPISHPNPSIEVTDDEELEVVFETPNAVKLLADLELQTKTEGETKESYTFVIQDQNRANFKVRFPEVGYYALRIYAKADSFNPVFNYMVNVFRPTANPKPFPEAYGEWGVGCDVIEPTNGVLPRHQSVRFSVKLPGAVDVATITDGKWTHLKQNAEGLWVGDAETGEEDEMTLYAKLDTKTKSYSAILDYQVEKKGKGKESNQAAIKALKAAEERTKKEQQLRNERTRQFKEAKKALLQAMQNRDAKKLRMAMKLVESRRFVSRLQSEMAEAKSLMKSLERIQALLIALLKLDQRVMQEIRGYRLPPAAVHDVMVAVLLLLGDHEEKTRDWTECQKLCKPTELNRRVQALDVTDLNPEISARVFNILHNFRVADVRATSAGAAAFYHWAIGMAQEHLQHKRGKRPVPADIKRQKVLLTKK